MGGKWTQGGESGVKGTKAGVRGGKRGFRTPRHPHITCDVR